MKRNKKHCNKRFNGLTILLTGVVFIIIVITMCIVALIGSFLYNNQLFREPQHPPFLRILLFIALLSTIIGCTLTLIFGEIPLKPINKLIDATEELSNGNFDVRINFDYPKVLNNLSISFNNMASELGSAKILRNDFVNNFSHEFKTPIVSLRGFAKLLKNDNLPKEVRDEYLDIIISESDRLATLATNILNLSNIENTNIISDQHDFDLAEQIRHSILMLESKWSDKNINMNIDLDETSYYGNEELLKQVWVNLIDNAIKFTPNNGDVKIELMSFEDSVIFKVKDTGIGMTQDVKAHIFDKFYQGDTSHTTEGNGLGLTMVKKIVELHNGNIDVKSHPNKGTIIAVTLPV